LDIEINFISKLVDDVVGKHLNHVNGSYVTKNDYSNSIGGHMTSGMSSMVVLFQHRPEHLPISTTEVSASATTEISSVLTVNKT